MAGRDDTAAAYADVIAAELAAIDRATVDGQRYPTAGAAVDAWAELAALEVRVTISTATGDVDGVEILRTYGGPTCRIDAHGDGYVMVRAYWGSDRAEAYVRAEAVDAWAWDYAETWHASRTAVRA